MSVSRRGRRMRRRVLHAVSRLNRAQWAAIVLVALAVVVGSIAAVTLASPRPAPTANDQLSAPLQAPQVTGGSVAASPTPGGSPETVRLLVPAVGIDLKAIPGDGVHVPLHLAMHYPGTDQPGDGGSSLYYAHAQPGMFQGLFDVKVGAEVRALRVDGSQVVYQVRTIRKVPWNDLSVLQPTPFEQLTLLTCTSYNPQTPRLIVVATPV